MFLQNTKCVSAAWILGLLVPCVCTVPSSHAWAAEAEKKQENNRYAYTFEIHGIRNADLKDELVKSAQLTTLKETHLNSAKGLERRVLADVESFKTILRAHGYFSTEVDYKITHPDEYKVDIHIKRGKLFKIDGFKLFWVARKNDAKARGLIDHALAKGTILLPHGKEALPENIQAPEQGVLSLLMQNGYPYPYIDERKLVVDHGKNTVAVALYFDAGPQAVFGNTALQGLETVDAAFIERRVAWKRGDEFDIRKVTKTRNDITRSGVIGSARVQYGGRPAAPKEKAQRITEGASLPMQVVMSESDHRTLGAGLAYSTSLGPSGTMFWEHRNMFGAAERFRTDLEVGTSIQGLGVSLSKPDLLGKRSLSYQSSFKLKDESLEAYDRRGVNITNGVTWQASNRLSFNGGVGLEHARIKESNKNEQNFTLMSFPTAAKYDSSDDLLNPKKGWRLSLGVTPYKAMNDALAFVHNDVSAINYWSLSKDVVWANRAKFGAIYGDGVLDLPADKRLFSGGGGSVRGYGYQMVGPLDADNDPIGGRMQVEFSTEMRVNVTEKIGAVGFFDAGQVSEDIGSSDGDLLYSAGVGARYHTVAGPIRFDIAVPLNKRRADDSFQIYISLGQAF